MVKQLPCRFCVKAQYSFILDYRGVGEEAGGRECRGLSKWNQGEIIEIS